MSSDGKPQPGIPDGVPAARALSAIWIHGVGHLITIGIH
jgi:hypothetical protein